MYRNEQLEYSPQFGNINVNRLLQLSQQFLQRILLFQKFQKLRTSSDGTQHFQDAKVDGRVSRNVQHYNQSFDKTT